LYDVVESEVAAVNKTLSLLTAAIFGLTTSLFLGVALHRLQILPAATIGSLAISVWGFTFALASRIQQPSPVKVEASHPPVIATGSVWGVGV
jgi:hypothetical protein